MQPRRARKLPKKRSRLQQVRSARLLPVRRKNHGRRRERGAAPRKLSPPPRDLARPPENLWPKNPLQKPHRRGEEALRKLAGVLRQSPEKVHAGAAKETGVQLLSRVRNCLRTADLQEHVYFP